MSDSELMNDDDGLNRSEDQDSNPVVQPLNEALSLRHNDVELDYEAEEDDHDVSKEEQKEDLNVCQVYNNSSCTSMSLKHSPIWWVV